jgi:hypothetical protein
VPAPSFGFPNKAETFRASAAIEVPGTGAGRRPARHGGAINEKKPRSLVVFLYSGSPTWTRTRDLRINSPSLYQLSYQGKEATLYISETRLSNFQPAVSNYGSVAFQINFR